jgi:hypothetical protein
MRRRGAGGASHNEVTSGRREDAAGQLPRRRSTPAASATPAGSKAGSSKTGSSKAGSSQGGPTTGAGDDMDEIEEILRRHGIQ